MKADSRWVAWFVSIILPQRLSAREEMRKECCENRGVVEGMMDHDRQQPSSSLPLALCSLHYATSSPDLLPTCTTFTTFLSMIYNATSLTKIPEHMFY
ncbi:hypothetical protein E2C01_070028 [Portunus trituberculatus]|uniref:Secreted protein n=1 Tax=Portunus trituberculatus TaxID=210409 RepID=A0A5B7I0H7_PORTR|nr:hypothetical protein [Portunus trituberculatus]